MNGIVKRAWLMVTVVGLVVGMAAPADAQLRKGRFGIGVDLGLQGGTVDDTAFAFGTHADFFLTDNISVGPLFQLGSTDDLLQVGLSFQGKYTVDLIQFPQLTPTFQMGLGFIHADLDRPRGQDKDDTSILIPIGIGLEYRITDPLAIGTTLLFNFTDLFDDENFHITWFVGTKFWF